MDLQEISSGASTLGELLLLRRGSATDGVRIVSDYSPGFVERSSAGILWSRNDLCLEAVAAARSLRAQGIGPGDHVLLLLAENTDFLRFFFACQLLSAVAVPLVPPWSLHRMEVHVARIQKVAQVCKPRATVISKDARVALLAFLEKVTFSAFGQVMGPEVATDAPRTEPLSGEFAFGDPDSIAMVQFTSGSTQDARGVLLSHRSLLANCFAIGQSLRFHLPGHVGCSWLPLFHDMGLIGHVLVPLLWQIPTVLLPPASFALRPVSWLEAISGFGATISTAPNFAYQMAATRLSEQKTRALDLSHWRVALCGGEPILAQSLDTFAERFSSNGFQKSALCPVYGLAESSLAVTLSGVGSEPIVETVDRARFMETGQAERVDSNEELALVSSGKAPEGHAVEVRDSSGKALPEGAEGEIWVQGPSLMSGYLNDPEASQRALKDGWLCTFDRGYLRDGQLFVTGRSKEVIIKGGRNLFPQEIEADAATVEGVRSGRVAAFGVYDEQEGTDRLVIMAETTETDVKARVLMERQVMEVVKARIFVRPDEVVLVSPGTLTKTSSGKMQRLEAQRRYLDGGDARPKSTTMKRARLLLARARLLFEPKS